MIQITAIGPSLDADNPTVGQGETEDKPIPAPSVISIKDMAPVTKAPAATAAQDTADTGVSFRREGVVASYLADS